MDPDKQPALPHDGICAVGRQMRVLQKRAQARPDFLHVAVAWCRRRLSPAHLLCCPAGWLTLGCSGKGCTGFWEHFCASRDPRLACMCICMQLRLTLVVKPHGRLLLSLTCLPQIPKQKSTQHCASRLAVHSGFAGHGRASGCLAERLHRAAARGLTQRLRRARDRLLRSRRLACRQSLAAVKPLVKQHRKQAGSQAQAV